MHFEDLQALLPDMPRWTKGEPRGEAGTMGMTVSRVQVNYDKGEITVGAVDLQEPSALKLRRFPEDGSTMRVLVLPTPSRPAALPAPATGREYVLLDVVIEDLKANGGIEFQGTQQLRLVNQAGGFIEASPLSSQLPCRLDEGGVIPGGYARRFVMVYDVPAGMPPKLHFRGFEKEEAIVETRK